MDLWQIILEFFHKNEVAWHVTLILLVGVLAIWILRMTIRRGVDRFVNGVKEKQQVTTTREISTSGLVRERAIQRTRTLAAVGKTVITWIILGIIIVLILAQFGIDLSAILAATGFIGAGLAFGAQSLVKDILNGIFMVIEDQLGVGDWVQVGTISGTVEEVGIRITSVRSTDGTLWFVRNGEILTLGNSSQGHGCALIDLVVDGESDIDLVEEVALEAADAVYRNPNYKRKIIGRPVVWGIQKLHGDRVTWRMEIRTRPEQHWSVQRAVRREVQARFRDAGISLSNELPDIPTS